MILKYRFGDHLMCNAKLSHSNFSILLPADEVILLSNTVHNDNIKENGRILFSYKNKHWCQVRNFNLATGGENSFYLDIIYLYIK